MSYKLNTPANEVIDELIELGLSEEEAIKLLRIISQVEFADVTSARATKQPAGKLSPTELLAIFKSKVWQD